MARLNLAALTFLAGVVAALAAPSPAHAQFGSIFAPPRPPAEIPNNERMAPPPPNFPTSRDRARDLNRNLPPDEPLPAPMNLPPTQRPGSGDIQSAPLAPPPGSQQPAAPLRTDRPIQQQPQQQTMPQQQQTLPGLAPGLRQPRGATQQPQQPAQAAPPSDEVALEPPANRLENPTAVFSGLDKITGRTISFDVAINETVQFGALQVTPRACYSRPPTETPRTDAFVSVDEVTLQGETRRIFTGWMFASSPGLHGVEHPIYDVWLTDCKGATQPTVAEAPEDKPAARPRQPTPAQQQRQPRRSNVQPPTLPAQR
jgi:hypothetical protein